MTADGLRLGGGVSRLLWEDRRPVALAISIAIGAWAAGAGWVPWSIPLVAPAGAVALSMASRRFVLLCGTAALLATCLAQRSLDGLAGPVAPRDVRAEVTLMNDPRPTPGGSVRADARLDGKRVALEAHRSSAAALRERLAGERISVIGELLPPTRYEELAAHRHLSGRLRVEIVVGWRPGHGITQLANKLRRTLEDGAGSLSDRHQSLLAGLLLGDSRSHPADLTDNFRSSGLAHLLVVSGSNVAFLMVVLAPLLQRLRLAPRLVVTLGALAGFALLTRGEPSVLRATAMAAIGAYAAATGNPMTGLRRLALAVGGLLLIDPLLLRSLGFQLSTAGAGGIILGASTLADRLRGPRWFTLPVAVTVSSELAVAPLLVTTFGSVPLVSVLANLLATPAAAPVKIWGLTGGLLAGVLGEPMATWLHLPTRLMLTWLDGVASISAGLPVGELGAGHLAALAAGGIAVGLGTRLRRFVAALTLRLSGASVVLGTVMAAVLAAPGSQVAKDGLVELGSGMDLWRGGGAAVVVIDGRATEDWIALALRREDVERVDVLVLRTPANRAVALAATLVERWPQLIVLAPAEVTETPGVRIEGALTPPPGMTMTVGDLQLAFDTSPDRLEPEISLDASSASAGDDVRPPRSRTSEP